MDRVVRMVRVVRRLSNDQEHMDQEPTDEEPTEKPGQGVSANMHLAPHVLQSMRKNGPDEGGAT